MITRYAQRNLTWVDLVNPSAAEVRQVMQEFELDPLIAQELLLPSFKPKVERRGEALYLILHFPAMRVMGNRPEVELDFVVGKHFLITTRYENVDPLHSFAKAFEVSTVLGRGGASHGGHLFIEMARSLYEALGDECAAVRRRLQVIEEQIFNGDEKGMVIELSHAGRVIHDFREVLLPHEEMLASYEPAATRLFGPEYGYHVRQLTGAYQRLERGLLHLRESLLELRETNNSLLTTKQNEIMKTLTIMAFVTFPLTLISSIFGMNTEYLPLVGLPGDFWIIVGAMLALATCFFIYFKRNGWL